MTDEPCGYVSLLALTEDAEGKGIAHRMMEAAETWARAQVALAAGQESEATAALADMQRSVASFRETGAGIAVPFLILVYRRK